MPPITEQSPATEQRRGSPQAEISSRCVRLLREYTGRGPTKARTTLAEDLVVVVFGDSMLKAEKSLIDDGKAPLVMELRREFQNTMGADLSSAVEEVLDRKVIAFMSANHLEPDLAAEVFILESDPRSDGLPNPSSDGVSPTD